MLWNQSKQWSLKQKEDCVKEAKQMVGLLLGLLVLVVGTYGYLKAQCEAPDPYAQCDRQERLEEINMTREQCRAAIGTGLSAGH